MARYFEKISFEQFSKDVGNDITLYNEYKLPSRDSNRTAGYDIFLLHDLEIAPGQILKLPTGVKAHFEDDEVLLLAVRSSMGFKHNLRLCNQIAIIDADYYNNESNEGHMWIRIQNEGDKVVKMSKGDAVIQGVFMKYLTTDSDAQNNIKRTSNY